MTFVGFLLLLLLAGICGSFAQALAGYSHGGCLVSIVLGSDHTVPNGPFHLTLSRNMR